MSEPTPQPQGYYRKEVYAIFEKMVGRTMTETEHNDLRTLLKSYIKDCEPEVIKSQATATAPAIEYTYTCGKCGGVKTGSGHAFKRKKAFKGAKPIEK